MEMRPSMRVRASCLVAVAGAVIAAVLAGHGRVRPVAAPQAHPVVQDGGGTSTGGSSSRSRQAGSAPMPLFERAWRSGRRAADSTAASGAEPAVAPRRHPGAASPPAERSGWPAPAAPRSRTVAEDAPPAEPIVQPFTDPPPSEALSISDVAATPATSSVRVTWQTNFPASGQGAEGLGETPLVWTQSDSALMPTAVTHETDFTGLDPATTYHLWVRGTDEWDRTATAELSVTTGPATAGPTPASVSGSTIFVAGQPFFPIALWDDCTNFADEHLAVGVNLFIREGCGHEDRLAAALHGRAYAVVDAQSGIADQPGVIGWYYTDELDGRQPATLTTADVGRMAITPPPGMLTFLTLTNHFYSRADPLAFPRAVYPAFAALANVVSFDLYPLQEWCMGDRIGDVFDSQRELVTLANAKPTFEWIEVRHMKCPAALDPTPQTVAAEAWLAIAAGATGIGWFPHDWTPAVGDEIKSIDQRIVGLKSALLAPAIAADANAPLRIGARSWNGALYVIAVNPTQTPVDGTLHVDGGGARTFDVLDEGRQVVAADGVLKDSFAPLAVHIYVSAPAEWNPAQAAPAAANATAPSAQTPGYFPP